MEPNSVKLHGLEKAMEARWALIFIASLAFADAYLLFNHHINLDHLNTAWVKSNFDLTETIKLISFFTITFGLVIPATGIIGRLILGTVFDIIMYKIDKKGWFATDRNRSSYALDKSSYLSIHDFRAWAIRTANSAAYRDLERFETDQKEQAFIRFICQAAVILSAIAYLFSTPEAPSLIEVISKKIELLPWYQEWPGKIIFSGIEFFVLVLAFRDQGEFEDHIWIGPDSHVQLQPLAPKPGE
jgi:hypothetical protein